KPVDCGSLCPTCFDAGLQRSPVEIAPDEDHLVRAFIPCPWMIGAEFDLVVDAVQDIAIVIVLNGKDAFHSKQILVVLSLEFLHPSRNFLWVHIARKFDTDGRDRRVMGMAGIPEP